MGFLWDELPKLRDSASQLEFDSIEKNLICGFGEIVLLLLHEVFRVDTEEISLNEYVQ